MLIVFFRTIIVFLTLLFSMRMMGKRQLGELELSELVIAVLVSNIAAHPLQDIGIPLLNGLLPVIILLCCELIISGMMVRSNRVKKIICGRPSMLIHNGVIDQIQMKKNRVTLDELADELRKKSVQDITTVEYGVLETDGKVNIILKPPYRPVTVNDLSLPYEDKGYPVIIINDGKLMEDNLTLCGRDLNWLNRELKSRKVSCPEKVYLMSVNAQGIAYFAAKDGKK